MLTMAAAFLFGLFTGGVFSSDAQGLFGDTVMLLFQGASGVEHVFIVGDSLFAQGLPLSGERSSSSQGPGRFSITSRCSGGSGMSQAADAAAAAAAAAAATATTTTYY